MNRALIIVTIITSIVFLNSCTFQSNRTNESIGKGLYEIDLDNLVINSDDFFLFSSVYKGVKTILLETNENCLIGGINKIRVNEHYIFVLDSRLAKSLYMFDKNGHFIHKIGGIGSGPGEYIQPTDFTIDKDNKTVYILDSPSRRIKKYDIISGRFINDIVMNPNISSRNIEYLEGKIYTDAFFREHSDSNYLLRVIDESSGKEEGFLNVLEFHKGISNTIGSIQEEVFFLKENGNIVFFQQFMDHIVEISKDGISSLISFKGSDILTSDQINKAIEKDNLLFFPELFQLNKYYHLFDFIEQANCIHFFFRKGANRTVKFLVDIKTKEVSAFLISREDFLATERNHGLLLKLGCQGSNGAYYYVPLREMPDFLISAKTGRLQPNLDRLEEIKNLEDDANPIIFYYEFK